MPYALFDRDRRIGMTLPSEADVWKQALEAGLVDDIPVADEAPGQVLPAGYHIRQVAAEEVCDPLPGWKLPREGPLDG
jgi:hypothetical protein